MSKLKLFRQIGEAQAQTQDADIIGNYDVANCFFEELVKTMYPENIHRRAWALSNLQLFYNQEVERIKIMKKLRKGPKDRAASALHFNHTIKSS